jgi:hypothetical protein
MVRSTPLIAALLLAGCATPAPEVIRWSRPGATYDEFLRDRYACITEARSQASSGFATPEAASARSGEIILADIALACLAARGWKRDANGFGPPDGIGVTLR